MRIAGLTVILAVVAMLCGVVSAAPPVWSPASVRGSDNILLQLRQLDAALAGADVSHPSEAAMARSAEIMARYGDVCLFVPNPGVPTPPDDMLLRAAGDWRWGFNALRDWVIQSTGKRPRAYPFRVVWPSAVLLYGMRTAGEWEGVESFVLSMLRGAEQHPELFGGPLVGLQPTLARARRELSLQKQSASVPLAVSEKLHGYVTAPTGSAELRRVAQWLGGKLTWDKAAETGQLRLGGDTWAFKLGSRTVASSSGKRMELPATVKMYDGRLRVPLEALKIAGTVKWDSTTRIAWFTPKQG